MVHAAAVHETEDMVSFSLQRTRLPLQRSGNARRIGRLGPFPSKDLVDEGRFAHVRISDGSLTCDPALSTARLMEWMPPPRLASTNSTSSTRDTADRSILRLVVLPPLRPPPPLAALPEDDNDDDEVEYLFRSATPCTAWLRTCPSTSASHRPAPKMS